MTREQVHAVVLEKRKILLADDSVTIQKVVNLTFADEGIEVVAVGDGDAAMQKFVESVPDLVMVDVNMPGADGYRICEMIKQDDETKHIPVILLVGSFEPFDEEEARRVNADDFLTKPFQSIRQLVNKVSDLLNGKNGGRADAGKFAGSFEDTLEMRQPFGAPEKKTVFGDTAMDDEMIQTNQIGSLPVNEFQKYESAPESHKPSEDDFEFDTETESEPPEGITSEKAAPESESSPVEIQEKFADYADEAENADDENEPPPRHENIYEFANEQELEDEENARRTSETPETTVRLPEKTEVEIIEPNDDEEKAEFFQEIAAPETIESPINAPENLAVAAPTLETEMENASLKYETTQEFELDDFDLLELPQTKKNKSPETKVVGDGQAKSVLSPEDIEAVADRVVEKLSRETVEEIVREVFSQITKKK